MNDGHVKCKTTIDQGNQYGILGNNTTTPSSEYVEVPGLNAVKSIDAGSSNVAAHVCVALNDGSVKCWGRYYFDDSVSLSDFTIVRSEFKSLVPLTILLISALDSIHKS